MKKIISVLIAFIVLLSTISICTITAFAQDTTKYWEPRPNPQGALGCVNDEPADGIYMVADEEYDASRIEYQGEGRLTGWEFPTLTEGKDYKIITQYDNTIIVKSTNGLPYINALVDFSDGSDNATADNNTQNITSAELETTEQNYNVSVIDTVDNTISANQNILDNIANINVGDDAKAMSIEAPEHNILNGTKTVLVCFCAGAAVCLIVLAMKKKKCR